MTSISARPMPKTNPTRVLELLTDAVAVYSPSYAESAAVDVFEEALTAAGLPVERHAVLDEQGEESDPPRDNLIVRLGPQPPALTWVGHTDTVVVIDDLQLNPELRDGALYGLGSVDMKGACAAAVEAFIALHESGIALERGVTLALVVGEEEYGDGAAALPDDVLAPLVVVGEPTELAPALRHFTYEEIELRAKGTRAHAALPEHGSNAIHAMLAWTLSALERTNEAEWPGLVAVNPRTIRGGDTMFAIAESCMAELDVHLAPGIEVERCREIVGQAAAATASAHPGCELSSETVFTAQGYEIDEHHPLLTPLRCAFERAGEPWAPADFRSHSDAAAIHARGCTTVVCGPGSLAVAHTVGEHILVDQLERGAELYLAMLVEAVRA